MESRISIGQDSCYVGGDDVLSNQQRSTMLKKILATGLIGSVILSLPLPASAKVIHNGTSKASGAMIARNALSASDQQAIRQLLLKMIQATNSGNTRAVVAGFSPNYQDSTSGGKNSYRNLRSGLRMMIAFMQAYGITLSAQDIQISSIGSNQALVNVGYKVDVSPEVLEEMSPEERERYQKGRSNSRGNMLFTLEKTGGRWLIVAMKDPSKGNSPVVPIAGGTMGAGNAAPPPKSASASSQERQAVRSLFAKHIQALNKEDLKGYLATLDPKSAQYDQVKQQTIQLFKDYNLKYDLKSLEIVSINGSTGVVKMVATVKRISGGSFRDSKIVTYNTISKAKGVWHISDTEVESLTSLR